MGDNDRNENGGQGNGQQGAGGIDTGRAASTPNQHGSQPQLGSAADRSAQSATGGTGETEGASEAGMTAPRDHDELDAVGGGRARGTSATRHHDRLADIELADDHTETLNPHRGAVAKDESGDVLSGPASNEDYVSEAHRETPILGAIDDDKDNR